MKGKLTPGKPLELPEIEMHGPYEMRLTVRFRIPDGGTGALDVWFEPGQLPTRAQQLALAASLSDPKQLTAAGAPVGTRLLTKTEFISFINTRATGVDIPVPGNKNFVPAACEIPQSMLVHAIMGAPVPEVLAQEYAARGLLVIDNNDAGTLLWNQDLLSAMPDTILLAMYQRITAPAPEAS